MRNVDLVLYVLAAVCFAVAAVNPPRATRVNLVGLGLLCWVLVPLITLARA